MSDELIVFVALEQYPHEPSHVVGVFESKDKARMACFQDNNEHPLTWHERDRTSTNDEVLYALTGHSRYSIRCIEVE